MPSEQSRKDIEHFNRWSRRYDRSWIQRFALPVHRDMLNVAGAMVPAPAVILDVGCGTGRLLMKAAERWPRASLTGVDPSDGMVEIARRQVQGAGIYLGNAESLPVADTSVDIVFSSISFHHWTDQAKGVGEIARVLRPGGCLCIADMTMPAWLTAFIRRVRVRSREEMARLFTGAGLSVDIQRRSGTWLVLLTAGIKKT